jgi:hypothetical protein
MATTQTIGTAAEAYDAYKHAFETDALIQSGWHDVAEDGRQLACALGVIGPEVESARDCPAQIMPRWLAQMVPAFFDNQDFADAKAWGLRFYAELARIGGNVPFSVVHDWQGNIVGPLAIETAKLRKRETEPHEKLQALHQKAFAGDATPRDEWHEALRPALYEVYRGYYANAYANANADAYANAYAYAYADANAYANARKAAWKRLADGMVECLSRVPAPAAEAA